MRPFGGHDWVSCLAKITLATGNLAFTVFHTYWFQGFGIGFEDDAFRNATQKAKDYIRISER